MSVLTSPVMNYCLSNTWKYLRWKQNQNFVKSISVPQNQNKLLFFEFKWYIQWNVLVKLQLACLNAIEKYQSLAWHLICSNNIACLMWQQFRYIITFFLFVVSHHNIYWCQKMHWADWIIKLPWLINDKQLCFSHQYILHHII